MWLGLVDNLPHLFLLSFGQLHIPRLPVLLQPLRFRGSRNSNHPLSGNPGKSDLRQGAASCCCKLLDLVNNRLVLVEVLALELRD